MLEYTKIMNERQRNLVLAAVIVGTAGVACTSRASRIEGSVQPSQTVVNSPTLTETITFDTVTPSPTFNPTPSPTLKPTRTSRPTVIATPTPNIYETQQSQLRTLENAERGDPFELNNASVTRVIRFPWEGGDAYIVELNDSVTAFQSDCIKVALEESGKLGGQVENGIWEPKAQMDVIRGKVKLSSNIAGSLLEPLGLKTPFVDLDEIRNNDVTYDCDVTTLGERGNASIGKIFEAARSQLEKIYPRIKQLGRIFGKALDLLERSLEP